MRGGEVEEGSPNKERGDCMGDGSLQSHSGANMNPKTAKDRSNVPKGGEAGGVALTEARVNDMETELISLRRRMAELDNDVPYKKPTSVLNTTTKTDLEVTNPAKLTDRIRRLGGKFAIMYMLWIGNTQTAFHTKLNANYTPMDRFKGGPEWKRQGEQANLREVFPEDLHCEFSGDLIYPAVCLHFRISSLTDHPSVSKWYEQRAVQQCVTNPDSSWF
jgi:hypothetical protein